MSRNNGTAAVILAAGLGTRMGGDLPKAALRLGGRPVIDYIVSAVQAAGIERIVVVIGHRGELVREALGDGVRYAAQEPQLGTAHALACAREALCDFDGCLVTLYCDVPLVPPELLRQLVRECEGGAAAALVTVRLEQPDAYGRVIRDARGYVVGVKEAAGAALHELVVQEVNAGVYCFRAPLVFDIIAHIERDPVKGEYYLTDAIGLLAARGHYIAAIAADDPALVMGINTPAELEQAERALRRKTEAAHE